MLRIPTALRVATCLVALSASAFAAEAPELRFDVLEYRVLGNSRLDAATIERAVTPFLGPDRAMGDVESARASLEGAYRAAGYGTVFVDVPEQDASQGIVRLRVTEGRVDRVRVVGARYFANGRIRDELPSLQKGDVPNLPAVQAELAALNRVTPDRVVVPVLKAGRIPGTVDVDLKVSDELPLHGGIEITDRYTADTSRWRASASLSYANLFQRFDRLSLQYQTAPESPSEVQAAIASYVFHLQSLPDSKLAVYAVDSSTDVAALGTLSVLGDGRIFGARWIQQLDALGFSGHGVTFGLDYKDFLENIQLAQDEQLQTPIEYLNWSIGWNGMVGGATGRTELSATLNWGMRRAGNSIGEFADKRFKGAPNYMYLRLGAARSWPVGSAWSLDVRASAQLASDPLVSNEQFGIGGADTVRGFLESSALGDNGIAGTLEIRNHWLARRVGIDAREAHVFAFLDGALVNLMYPLPAQEHTLDLGGFGAGVRLLGWHGFDIVLEAARAMSKTQRVAIGDIRAHVRLGYSF